MMLLPVAPLSCFMRRGGPQPMGSSFGALFRTSPGPPWDALPAPGQPFKALEYFDKLSPWGAAKGRAFGPAGRADRGKPSMIYDPAFETMPRHQLEQLQLERLLAVTRLANERMPFYQRKFKEIGLDPRDVRSLSDLAKLPLTRKEDLSSGYPEGFSAAQPEDIIRYHASSGTTGRLTVVGFTQADLANWTLLMARCFAAAGVAKRDVVNVAFNYGLFTGGLGAHYGAEAIGAAVVQC